MFEQHIAETRQFIQTRTIGNEPRIVFQAMLDSDVPQSLKQFFRMDILTWIQEERARLLNSPHFDYSDAGILSLFDEILSRSEPLAAFSREEFDTAIDKAIKLLFNYVCHPQWTLSKFIFDDKEHAHIDDILSMMSYFTDYPYYRAILEEFFASKNYLHFKRDKFEELLLMIDQELVKDYDSRHMAELAKPLFELFNIVPQLDEPRVPVEALSIFYEDKELKTIVDALDAEKNSRESMSMHELIMFLGEIDISIGMDISSIVHHHKVGRSLKDDDIPLGGTRSIIPPNDEIPQEPMFLEIPETPQPLQAVYEPDVPNPPMTSFLEDELPPVRLFDDDEVTSPLPMDDTLDNVFNDTTVLIPHDGDDAPAFIPGSGLDEPLDLPPLKLVEDEELPGVGEAAPRSLQDDLTDLRERLNRVLAPQSDIPINSEFEEEKPTSTMMEELLVEEPVAPPLPEIVEPPLPGPVVPPIPDIIMDEPPAMGATDEEALAPPAPNLPDLRSLIPDGDRKKFVKKLFKRNDITYEKAINDLNATAAWREASEKIDEVFVTNNIDTYSKYALRFTEFIYKRFETR